MLRSLLRSMVAQLRQQMLQSAEPENRQSCLVDIWPVLQRFSALPPRAPMGQRLSFASNLLNGVLIFIEKRIPPSVFDQMDTGPRPNGC